MQIDDLIIPFEILDKLIWKHSVSESEVRQIFHDAPRYRFMEAGKYMGEHLYLALGTTESGRYLSIFFIYKRNKNALIVTARDMTENERKRYAKK